MNPKTSLSPALQERDRRISAAAAPFAGRSRDPRYYGFFQCFNDRDFYEAHEVLESLWLGCRGTPAARFYQGLIQLAGAFVHLQKQRPGPAAALFRLADANLALYPPAHEGLDAVAVRGLIAEWLAKLGTLGAGDTRPLAESVPVLMPGD